MNGNVDSFNWPLFGGLIVVILIYSIFSYIALDQIRKYGFVGDLCEKMIVIYPTASIIFIIISIILYITA